MNFQFLANTAAPEKAAVLFINDDSNGDQGNEDYTAKD